MVTFSSLSSFDVVRCISRMSRGDQMDAALTVTFFIWSMVIWRDPDDDLRALGLNLVMIVPPPLVRRVLVVSALLLCESLSATSSSESSDSESPRHDAAADRGALMRERAAAAASSRLESRVSFAECRGRLALC